MSVEYLELVREFHKKFGHYTKNSRFTGDCYPYFPADIVKLRQKLITEEAEEFSDASYCDYNGASSETIGVDLVGLADALADLLYVTFGAALTYGIPIEEVFKEVHRSNMTKSMLKDEKSIKGKTIKGPSYEPPEIKKV